MWVQSSTTSYHTAVYMCKIYNMQCNRYYVLIAIQTSIDSVLNLLLLASFGLRMDTSLDTLKFLFATQA